jgi:hypothetical protein
VIHSLNGFPPSQQQPKPRVSRTSQGGTNNLLDVSQRGVGPIVAVRRFAWNHPVKFIIYCCLWYFPKKPKSSRFRLRTVQCPGQFESQIKATIRQTGDRHYAKVDAVVVGCEAVVPTNKLIKMFVPQFGELTTRATGWR